MGNCCGGLWGEPKAPERHSRLDALPADRCGGGATGCGHVHGVNLNTATEAQLNALPGVGAVITSRIVQARPFPVTGSASVLLRVRGVGKGKVRLLQPRLCPCFGGPAAEAATGVREGATGAGGAGGHGGGESAAALPGEAPVSQPSGAALIASLPPEALRVAPQAVLPPPAGVCDRDGAAGATLAERVRWGDLAPDEVKHDSFNIRHLTDDSTGTSSVLVGSWNIRNLSCRRRALRLGVVARVLSQFDVVAVQEARDTQIVVRLLSQLNACSRWPVWRCAVSGPVHIVAAAGDDGERGGRASSHWEYYAFFWQEHRVRLVGKPEFASRDHHEMAREPFFAYFRCRIGGSSPAVSSGRGLDFVLVNVHIVFAKGDRAARRREVRQLQTLIDVLRQRIPHEDDIILAGDFNMGPRSPCWRDGPWNPLIHKPTTIYRSAYDNICVLDGTQAAQWRHSAGVARVDAALYPGVLRRYETPEAKAARKACNRQLSDHRPVWAQFHAMHRAHEDSGTDAGAGSEAGSSSAARRSKEEGGARRPEALDLAQL